MTRNVGLILHTILLSLQFLIPTLPVPAAWVPTAHAVPALANAIIGVLAFSTNPDGTSAKTAYIPEAKS